MTHGDVHDKTGTRTGLAFQVHTAAVQVGDVLYQC
jgi:hypothetical protein